MKYRLSQCPKCGNLRSSSAEYCSFCGYRRISVFYKDLPSYNMLCLKEDGTHPPFPFELWGYIGFLVKDENDLGQARIKNNAEGERRRRARI